MAEQVIVLGVIEEGTRKVRGIFSEFLVVTIPRVQCDHDS